MRHKVCIRPGVRALSSSATLSLRRGSRFLSSRSKAYPRPHSSESRQTTRMRPRAELSSHPARDSPGAIPAQAKADVVVVFFDPAAKERRRIRPTAHHIPASPPLQHLDEAIIVLPGAILYFHLGLMVWLRRSLRPVRASAVDVTGSLQRPQAYPPAHPREVLTSARTRRRAAVGRACSTSRGSTLTSVHAGLRGQPLELCLGAQHHLYSLHVC
jgi:hypothetical protein